MSDNEQWSKPPEPQVEPYAPGRQQDPIMKDGKRVKVSPRITAEQYEPVKSMELRELLKAH